MFDVLGTKLKSSSQMSTTYNISNLVVKIEIDNSYRICVKIEFSGGV
jgi:hypothetical protein